MPLDKAAEQYLQERRQEGVVDVAHLTPAEARRLESADRVRYGAGPEMYATENLLIPGSESSVAVRLHLPVPTPTCAIVYLHGGGWVLGDIDDYDALLRTLALETGCAIVMVNYRKAPEHPFPAAVIDAHEATKWAASFLRERFPSIKYLVIAGDSAGGNLAAVVAQSAKRDATLPIDFQILIYPVLDDDFTRPSYRDQNNQLLLTTASMQWFWNHYVPEEKDRSSIWAAPAKAGSLVGLPPALIITAENDVLRSESDEYAQRLRDAGVPVSYTMFKGQMHGFFGLHNLMTASDQARKLIGEELVDRFPVLGT